MEELGKGGRLATITPVVKLKGCIPINPRFHIPSPAHILLDLIDGKEEIGCIPQGEFIDGGQLHRFPDGPVP